MPACLPGSLANTSILYCIFDLHFTRFHCTSFPAENTWPLSGPKSPAGIVTVLTAPAPAPTSTPTAHLSERRLSVKCKLSNGRVGERRLCHNHRWNDVKSHFTLKIADSVLRAAEWQWLQVVFDALSCNFVKKCFQSISLVYRQVYFHFVVAWLAAFLFVVCLSSRCTVVKHVRQMKYIFGRGEGNCKAIFVLREQLQLLLKY